MRLFLCLFAAFGLAVGASSSKPQWNSVFADPVVDCPDYPPPAVSSDTLLQQLQPFLDDLAKNMSNLLQQTESPGAVVIGLVYNQTLLWTKGFGQTNKIDTGPPSETTAFRVGSITKVFTSLMMLIARDQGLIGLDDELAKHLPEFQIQNPFQSTRSITLKQLASHMAGIPLSTPCRKMSSEGCNATFDEIYEDVAKLKLVFPPGLSPSYSYLGFGALGRALGKVAGSSWEELVQKQVITPLGLKSTGVKYTEDVRKILATGYTQDGTTAGLIETGLEAPASQMYSSVADLAELMMLIFRDMDPYVPNTKQLLDGETIREWMQPAYVYFDGSGYGYPWEILPSSNFSLRTKIGVITGYRSRFVFVPEIKTGIVLLQSCDCTSFVDLYRMAQTIFPKVTDVLHRWDPYPSGPGWIQNYTGVYSNPKTPALVNIKTDYITLSTTLPLLGVSAPLNLAWLGGNTFQFSAHRTPHTCATLSSGVVGEYVYFKKEPNAMAESFTIPGIFGFEAKFTRVS